MKVAFGLLLVSLSTFAADAGHFQCVDDKGLLRAEITSFTDPCDAGGQKTMTITLSGQPTIIVPIAIEKYGTAKEPWLSHRFYFQSTDVTLSTSYAVCGTRHRRLNLYLAYKYFTPQTYNLTCVYF